MEGGDNFFLLFLALFFVVFALKSLSLGSGILVRFGGIVGLNSSKTSFSIFWVVLLVIVILFMIYGSFDAPMRQQNGTAGNVLALLMVIGGLISLYTLFTPKQTPPVPETSSGFGFSGTFVVVVVIVIVLLMIGYGLMSESSSSSMKMENGTVITLSLLMVFIAIFAVLSLFTTTKDSTPTPSNSTGILTTFGFSGIFVIIVIALSIVGYCCISGSSGNGSNNGSSSSMKMENGTVITLSMFMVFIAIFAVHSLFTSNDTPAPPSKSTGFLPSMFGFSGIFVIVIALLIIGYISFSGNGSSSSSTGMDSGTVIALSVSVVFVAIFALTSLFASKDAPVPESSSTGRQSRFPSMFSCFIAIVIFFICIMVYKLGTPKTGNNNRADNGSFDPSSMEMGGDSFVLLFLVLFFVIFALKSLSIPKGTGILARSSSPFSLPSISFFWIIPIVIGLLFAVYASSDESSTKKNYSTDITLSLVMIIVGLFAMYSLFTPKETPSESSTSMFAFSSILFSPVFWSVVVVIMVLVAVYGTFNGSSSKMEYGTVVALSLLMVFFAIFALNTLFTPNDSTPQPSKSSGFLSSMFFCSLLMVIFFLVMVYGRSSGASSTNMEGDNYMIMYLALFFVAFALHYLFTPGKADTPTPESTGFGFGPLFWCVLIVIVLLIMAYCSSDARSMKMEDGTAVMLSVLMVFVAVFVLYSMFTPKAAPPPPPPKSSGFLASIVFSPFFWVAGMVIFLVISNS